MKQKLVIGFIVGILIGSALAMLVGALLCLCARRRRQKELDECMGQPEKWGSFVAPETEYTPPRKKKTKTKKITKKITKKKKKKKISVSPAPKVDRGPNWMWDKRGNGTTDHAFIEIPDEARPDC